MSFIASSPLPKPYDKLARTAESPPDGAVGNRRKEAQSNGLRRAHFWFEPRQWLRIIWGGADRFDGDRGRGLDVAPQQQTRTEIRLIVCPLGSERTYAPLPERLSALGPSAKRSYVRNWEEKGKCPYLATQQCFTTRAALDIFATVRGPSAAAGFSILSSRSDAAHAGGARTAVGRPWRSGRDHWSRSEVRLPARCIAHPFAGIPRLDPIGTGSRLDRGLSP